MGNIIIFRDKNNGNIKKYGETKTGIIFFKLPKKLIKSATHQQYPSAFVAEHNELQRNVATITSRTAD